MPGTVAAAAPDKKAVGYVQTTGRQAKIPSHAVQNASIFRLWISEKHSQGEAGGRNEQWDGRRTASPTARSERRPHQTITPTGYGAADTKVVGKIEPKCLDDLRQNKLRPQLLATTPK